MIVERMSRAATPTFLLLAATTTWCQASSAAVLDGNPSNYRALLSQLAPGDTLNLAAGNYTEDLPLNGIQGTAQQPIVIVGPQDRSAVFLGRSCCNTVQFGNSAYIEVRNLTLDGRHLPEPFGIDSNGPSHHITIQNLRIINYDADQSMVAISTKAPAWNWTIRGNVIESAGTGMYLGNSDGNQQFVAGLIEGNLIVDSLGYNIQIKHQNPRPTNIGMPTSASKTIIRNNVFSKKNRGSTGGSARPNLLVGHFPLSGAGTNDLYEIYGNFFYENPTEALFQGEGNIALYNNLFVNSAGRAIAVMPQNALPRSVTIFNNTVVASTTGISVSGGEAGYTQRIAANAVFAATPISGPNQVDNVAGSYASASSALVAPFAAIGSLDLYPVAGALSSTPVDPAAFTGFTQYDVDFNGRARDWRLRGAYSGDGTNPGWKLALERKVLGAVQPTPAAPTVVLTASPPSVASGATSTLTWTAVGATACTASGGWSGSRSATGSERIGPLTAATQYAIRCSGAGGAASASVQVSLIPPPTVSIQAQPSTVESGGSSILSWSSSGANGCEASGAWSGSMPTSGTQSVGPLASSGQFQLNCTGAGGVSTASAGVTVQPASTPNAGQTSGGATTSAGTPGSNVAPPTVDTNESGGAGSFSWYQLLSILFALVVAPRPGRPAR